MSIKSTAQPIRIGVLAGEEIRLQGLTMIFEQADPPPPPDQTRLVPVFDTLDNLLANPEVEYLVVDLNSADGGLHTLAAVSRARPAMRQIVIGPDEDDKVLDAIRAGARAYLYPSANPETVRQALDIVVSGSIWAPRRLLSRLIDQLLHVPGNHASPSLQLTLREREVLDLVLHARSNREIAEKLGIEERTVKAHIGRLMRKTGAVNRIQLSTRALNSSLVPEGHRPAKGD